MGEGFDGILPNLCKHETIIENYLITKEEETREERSQFFAFQEPIVKIFEPKLALWEFMNKNEMENYLKLSKKKDITDAINSKMREIYPRGKTRIIFIELMYNVTKFCKKSNLNLPKSGTVLSIFYLTHIYFTSGFDISAEKVYCYFKDLALSHSLPFPPKSIKLFSHKETKSVMELFCKLYLRNLPLIRFLSLPNFALYLHYFPPEPEIDPSGRGKKDKGEKSKKKGAKPDKRNKK